MSAKCLFDVYIFRLNAQRERVKFVIQGVACIIYMARTWHSAMNAEHINISILGIK